MGDVPDGAAEAVSDRLAGITARTPPSVPAPGGPGCPDRPEPYWRSLRPPVPRSRWWPRPVRRRRAAAAPVRRCRDCPRS